MMGLNALGTIYTFYKLPQYTCLWKKGAKDTLHRAKTLCQVQKDKGLRYKYTTGAHPAGFKENKEYKKGSPEYFFQIRFNDVDEEYVNPCDIVTLNECAEPPPKKPRNSKPPAPPPPPPAPPKPPKMPPAPTQPPKVPQAPPPAPPPYQPPVQADTPTPIVVLPPPPIVYVTPPAPTYPQQTYAPPEEPAEVFRNEPVLTTPVPIEEPEPEKEEDNGSLFMVGGILAILLAGGVGYAVFKSRKKKKKR